MTIPPGCAARGSAYSLDYFLPLFDPDKKCETRYDIAGNFTLLAQSGCPTNNISRNTPKVLRLAICRKLQASDADVLGFQAGFDTFVAQLATEATLFPTAEGRA